MPSYSSVDFLDGNGPLKMHAHSYLINTVLKEELGFSGFVISDWQGGSGNTTPGTTVLQAIQNMVASETTVEFKQRPTGRLTGDFGVVVIGEKPYAEGLGDDKDLALEVEDRDAVSNVCRAMPCVVILISGRPMIINDQLAQSNAFVAAWLPGTEGQGIADVIFGDYNFTGILPMTWPDSIDQLPINIGNDPL